jgi:histidinol-phosphate aminotransferase
MLGNGSDELISLLAMACLTAKDKPKNTILAPLPGFVMYEMSAQLQGLDFVGVPLTPDFELEEAAMLAAVNKHQPAITYIAYPNNPTANLWDANAIRKIITACNAYGGLVVMDEAYQPFSPVTWLDEITLSKFGLAGVRLGYMIGSKLLIDQIDKLRPPYNVSNLNAECALFALAHKEVFDDQAKLIKSERERLSISLAALPNVKPFNSDANMILVRFPDADATFTMLKAKGILVKNVSKMHLLLANCLRLTVGTPEENNQLLAALQ